MTRPLRRATVPVPGGELVAGVWDVPDPGAATDLLCIHGITSSHRAFAWLAEELPHRRIIAPDLRGRGGSGSLAAPYGMAAHADDAVRLLDLAGVEQVEVVGHSMGGFVGVVLAHRHPDRVSRLVLVDGGLPIPAPPGLGPDELLQAVIGPAADRLAMRFSSAQEHRDFWRAHPAFAKQWSPELERYVDYDLIGDAPELRSSSTYAAVVEDSTDLHRGTDYLAALEALSHPSTFLRAERGMLDQPQGLYDEAAVAELAAATDCLTARTVPDVNHYTVLMSAHGAAEVAAETT